MIHSNKRIDLISAIINRLAVLTLHSTLFFAGLVSPLCIAQETNKPQSVATGSAQKPAEMPPTPPSLSSLVTQTVIFLYQDNTSQNINGLVAGRVLGTAFIVGVPQPGQPDRAIPFIVTAKHVVADQNRVLGRYTNKSGTEPVFAQYDLE